MVCSCVKNKVSLQQASQARLCDFHGFMKQLVPLISICAIIICCLITSLLITPRGFSSPSASSCRNSILKKPRDRAGGRPPVLSSFVVDPTIALSLMFQVRGRVASSHPHPCHHPCPHASLQPSQAGSPICILVYLLETTNNLKSPIWWTASRGPKSFTTHQGPSSHPYPNPPLPQCGSHYRPPSASSPTLLAQKGSETGGDLSAQQLFTSLHRGNLGLFMEIQMLLNNRCCSEKENFFYYYLVLFEGFVFLVFLCSLEKS